jgi:hypothetical protein
MVAWNCYPSYVGGINGKITIQVHSDKSDRPYLKDEYSKKGEKV